MALPQDATPALYDPGITALPFEDLSQPTHYLDFLAGFTAVEEWKSGRVSGVVTVTGTPAAQTVRVYRRSDRALVGETQSTEDGTYTITGLDPAETHYVVALHATLEYNAVVADNITPEDGA